jgi:hypothetical protein
MFFPNIKDRSLPVLEQSCERYALMTYEVFRGEVACGLKSIGFSYKKHSDDFPDHGIFTATFMPFTGVRTGHKATQVTFVIYRGPDDYWELKGCQVHDLENPSEDPEEVTFTEEGCLVAVSAYDEALGECFRIGNGPDARPINVEDALKKYTLLERLLVY